MIQANSQPNYEHPHAAQILEQALKTLEDSDTAQKAKVNAEKSDIDVHVIKGPVAQPFVADEKTIFLRVPAIQQNGRLEQALDLAAAYIEINYRRKNTIPITCDLNNEDVMLAHYFKNIDVLCALFDVVHDLEDAGYKAVHEIRKIGASKIYHAWKTGAEREECVNLYLDYLKGS